MVSRHGSLISSTQMGTRQCNEKFFLCYHFTHGGMSKLLTKAACNVQTSHTVIVEERGAIFESAPNLVSFIFVEAKRFSSAAKIHA